MSSKRYNIWMDEELIAKIKASAKILGIKASTYIRMAVLEKLRGMHDETRSKSLR
jgi:predicted DNA binding CopG/RHH family protein